MNSDNTFGFEEHVLCMTKADTLSAKATSTRCIFRAASVGQDFQATALIGPSIEVV